LLECVEKRKGIEKKEGEGDNRVKKEIPCELVFVHIRVIKSKQLF